MGRVTLYSTIFIVTTNYLNYYEVYHSSAEVVVGYYELATISEIRK